MGLELTTYDPVQRFRDPRVRRRVGLVLKYVEKMVKHDAVVEIHYKRLRQVFGNTKTKGSLAQYLYANLLHQELWYAKGLHPYSYRAKPDGLAKIKRLLAETA